MGEVFAGRYELLDQIGEGGMGSVWRVHDRRTDRIVAAKVLRSARAGMLLRFVREQAVRIEHPHVVVPLGWAGEDDRVLFTMPIVHGGSLKTLSGDFGPLPPLLVAELMRQVLSALDAVHAARIVHRDLKPENVLLDATGRGRPHAYLSDFGIAVDLDGPRFTETGFVTGTPGYLAPELRALSEPTPAADLYSLGRVAATLLTGLPARELVANPEPPAGVPASLWALVDALTRHDPDARPTSADAARVLASPELAWTPDALGDVEVFDQLSPLPGHEVTPVDAAPAPTQPAASPPAQRAIGRRDALVLGGLAVLALLGVLLMWQPWAAQSEAAASAPPTSATPTDSATTSAIPSRTPASSAGPSVGASSTGPSAAAGGLTVRTVVQKVGQPCESVQVGQQSSTVEGVPVTCVSDATGTTWRRS